MKFYCMIYFYCLRYFGFACQNVYLNIYLYIKAKYDFDETVARLFTREIADFYEEYYESKGVNFIKGTVLSSFENDSNGKVGKKYPSHHFSFFFKKIYSTYFAFPLVLSFYFLFMNFRVSTSVEQVVAVILRDGTRVATDMVVVGIGITPNTSLFDGQLTIDQGGVKVNGLMQTSNSSVYAVGDVAAFPVKLFGGVRRLEHVDSARKTAKHAVNAIMEPTKTKDLDYLPFFYSRVFGLSWQFYGDNKGEVVHFGDFSGKRFGAYWIDREILVGAFLEGGTREEYEALANAIRLKLTVRVDLAELERQGLNFAMQANGQEVKPESGLALERPLYAWHAVAGVAVAASVAGIAYLYGRRRKIL